MKKIKLTQGKYTKLDDDDFDKFFALNWYAQKRYTSNCFCAVRMRKINNKRKNIYLHREIMDCPSNLQVDHIKPWALYPELRYATNNGKTLCVSCHRNTDTWGGKTRKVVEEVYYG